ncbi:hypothetical protein TNCV_1632671 [Trichonephila clavipes]|nr:hypothetical protein TNCV_1632671 [Trichonephila clavipes]
MSSLWSSSKSFSPSKSRHSLFHAFSTLCLSSKSHACCSYHSIAVSIAENALVFDGPLLLSLLSSSSSSTGSASYLHGSHNLVTILHLKPTVFCIACHPGFYIFIAFLKFSDRSDKVCNVFLWSSSKSFSPSKSRHSLFHAFSTLCLSSESHACCSYHSIAVSIAENALVFDGPLLLSLLSSSSSSTGSASYLHGSHNLVTNLHLKPTVFCIACHPGYYIFFAFLKSLI